MAEFHKQPIGQQKKRKFHNEFEFQVEELLHSKKMKLSSLLDKIQPTDFKEDDPMMCSKSIWLSSFQNDLTGNQCILPSEGFSFETNLDHDFLCDDDFGFLSGDQVEPKKKQQALLEDIRFVNSQPNLIPEVPEIKQANPTNSKKNFDFDALWNSLDFEFGMPWLDQSYFASELIALKADLKTKKENLITDKKKLKSKSKVSFSLPVKEKEKKMCVPKQKKEKHDSSLLIIKENSPQIKRESTEPSEMPEKTDQIIVEKLHCSQCGLWLEGKRELADHIKVSHKRICLHKKCGKLFDSKKHLQDHINEDHSNYHNFQCAKCDTVNVFKNYPNLFRHDYLQHQKGLFKCANVKCNFSKDTRGAVYSHFDYHHQRRVCTFQGCGKKFKRFSLLEAHWLKAKHCNK